MPPFNFDSSISRVGPPEPNPAQSPRRTPGRAQSPQSRADNASPGAKPITGKVYALKDGSGYVALASDGSYCRVDAGSGHHADRKGPANEHAYLKDPGQAAASSHATRALIVQRPRCRDRLPGPSFHAERGVAAELNHSCGPKPGPAFAGMASGTPAVFRMEDRPGAHLTLACSSLPCTH